MADRYAETISECHRLIGRDLEGLSDWTCTEADEVASTLILLLEAPNVSTSTKTSIVALVTDMINGKYPSEVLCDRFILYVAKEICSYRERGKLPPINYIYAFEALSQKSSLIDVLSAFTNSGFLNLEPVIDLIGGLVNENGDLDETKLNRLYDSEQEKIV